MKKRGLAKSIPINFLYPKGAIRMWVIDFEASGLDRASYPIEVGVTNGGANFSGIIAPMPHWSFWSTEAEAVHGISREHIECHGLWPETIASKLNNILRGETVYCDSVAWDGFWLNVLFSDCAIQCEFELLDIQELLLDSDSALEIYVSERLQLVDSGDFREHRALDDARMTYLALQKALSEQ